MNKVILRFYIFAQKDVFEAVLDNRLSFAENFKMLSEILDRKFTVNKVVDEERKIALKMDVPIKEFNFPNFMRLNIY